jgi:cytochrome c-type biogenesis protein CcmH/NrfG
MPRYAEAYYSLGLALREEGKMKSAEEAFRTAQQLDPELKRPGE